MFKAFLGFLLIASGIQTASAACNIPVREKSYEKYQQGTYYDVLWVPKSSLADLNTSRAYNYVAHFKKKVQERTKTDFKFLLERQKTFFKNFPEETKRFNKALAKKIGRTRGVSCLENFLLDNHLRTFSAETEFSAYVLTKFDSDQALVVIYTQLKNGTVANAPISALVENYRKQGWNVESHIHNHPFFFKNPYGDIAGTILPSSADITAYKELGESMRLRSGMVTNGFETFIVYRNDFDRM